MSSFQKTTRCIAVDQRKLISLQTIHNVNSDVGPREWEPCVVLCHDEGSSLKQNFANLVRRFEETDDVFSAQFLTSWVLINCNSNYSHHVDLDDLRCVLEQSAKACGHGWKPQNFIIIGDTDTPEGPYYIKSGLIAQAWGLYPDYTDSFQLCVLPENGLRPGGDHRFKPLHSMSDDGLSKNVAVPSRLYSRPTTTRPLSGTRISVKDNIRLKGVHTSCQNRSFLNTYDVDEETAPYVQRLIELGAVVVGKTKLGAFASAEDPPLQWVDYPCPWSVRGDGYQQPLGSTTGGVTSIIAYPWLDSSIGTDTTGSIRAPAAHNGSWGFRPSHELASSFKGIYPNCPQFDTIGYLTRSVEELKHIAQHSFDEAIEDITQFPRKIIWNTDFWDQKPHTEPYLAVVLSFVKILEKFLGVQMTKLSVRKLWEDDPPVEAQGKSLEEFLEKSIYAQGLYDAYWLYEDFRQDHKKKFGKPAYLTPYMAGKWEAGRAITKEEKAESVDSAAVFRDWFRKRVLRPDSVTASDAIMLLPQGSGKGWYRDEPVSLPYHGNGYQGICMAPLTGSPQLVIPIGQVPYHSRITDRQEYLPVAATILGARGSDLMLMNLAYATLKSASWPTEVQIGSLAFKMNDERDGEEICPQTSETERKDVCSESRSTQKGRD